MFNYHYPLCFIRYISTVLPLMGFSWWQIKNDDSVTLYVSFDKNDSITPYVFLPWWLMKILYFTRTISFFFSNMLPLIFYLTKTKVFNLTFFFMTTNKKQQCHSLCFLSWRPIKNNSVTPYVFFHDDQ